jgi:phosphoglucomutase
MALEARIQGRIEQWLKPPYDPDTIAEIQSLLRAGNEKELQDRFYTELEFGTGGLRGVMGAGLNRMNQYVVGRATQGLANYILKTIGAARRHSVAIARDSRLRSAEFARVAACVLAGNGIRAYLFDALRPTPELSFAVRHLAACAGIVITASHNPKEYNGYKAYWGDGAQVVPPHDTGIIAQVRAISDVREVRKMDYDQAVQSGMIEIIGSEVDEAYLKAILPLSIQPALCRRIGKTMKIVYTPLHGAGISLVPEALSRWGFEHVHLCAAQREPDGNFPGAPSPNPEEPAALEAAIADARALGADLVLATDPDADRVGIAIRDADNYRLVTGNQIAALLVEYVLSSRAATGTLPGDARVVKTIVTSELLTMIANHYGVRIDNTLTGFKWIGERIRQYEEQGEGQYLVGGEESYGYLVGTHARDKDAVVCSCMIAEMAADSASRGETLAQRLDSVFSRFGIYQESQLSVAYPGAEGQRTIEHIMAQLRARPPREFAGIPVERVEDYGEDTIRNLATGAVIGKTNLPKSNVLIFRLAGGTQITARPSGTEPKIKFYFSVCDRANLPIPSPEELARRKLALATRHEAIREDFQGVLEKIRATLAKP